MIRVLKALFSAIFGALRDFHREQELHEAIEQRVRDDAEISDLQNAARIDRAVDALRTDGLRDAGAPGKPDTRGYRD